MNTWERMVRHARLTARNYIGGSDGPPFLILFINSICNQTCEHCFYWRSLNSKDDLTLNEIRKLSEELGPVENLNYPAANRFCAPNSARSAACSSATIASSRSMFPPTVPFPKRQ